MLQVTAPYGVSYGVGEESQSQRTEEDIQLAPSQLLRKTGKVLPNLYNSVVCGVDEVRVPCP